MMEYIFLAALVFLFLVGTLVQIGGDGFAVFYLFFLVIILGWMATAGISWHLSVSMQSENAYESVDQIMWQAKHGWIVDYVLQKFGWLISIVFFFMAWLAAWVVRRRRA